MIATPQLDPEIQTPELAGTADSVHPDHGLVLFAGSAYVNVVF